MPIKNTIVVAIAAAALLVTAFAAPARAAEPAPMKVIFDTDIGDDIDDAYALALLASRPSVKLLGVTTAFGKTRERAEIAAKLLQVMNRKDIPIHAGRRTESVGIGAQHAWAAGFQSKAIKEDDAVAFMKRQLDRSPGNITLIAVGPLTNVGDLVTRHPEVRAKIKQIVIMGGAVHVGYSNMPPAEPEWNIKCDPAGARAVFEAGVPLTVAGLEATTMMKLEPPLQKRLFGRGHAYTDALAALTNLWGGGVPTLFDTVAVSHAIGERHHDEEKLRITVEDNGLTRAVSGAPNATLLIKPRREAFMEWFVTTLGAQ